MRRASHTPGVRSWIVIAVAAAIAFAMPLSSRWTAHADSLAGSQGTDTSLPLTNSAVSVQGRGAYSSLKLTINETRDLVNQAIAVSWTGATPTFSDTATHAFSNAFNGDYLQIFQCWGDPDAADPLTAVNPGPSPTQCQFGGESNSPESAYPIKDVGFEYSRVLSQPTWPTYAASPGWVDASTGYKVEPFKSVDGTVVNQQADYNYAADPLHPKGFWQEPYFSFNTSNEIPFARTYPDASGTLGHGQQIFQVQTGLEAPGLGCGQKLQQTGSGKKRPQCWLVVVPRGAPADENPTGVGLTSVLTSPLTPAAWANRIAIPLGFKPVDSTCPIGTDERRIVGSELAVAAITSWQPALCATKNSPPYSYSYLSDDRARENLTEQGFGGAGMSVYTEPPDKSTLQPGQPIVSAPLTLSGEVVGFNIERTPTLGSNGLPNPDEDPLSGIRIQHLQLTPRLVAKLLTQSYQAQLVDVLATKPAKYSWVLSNPVSIVNDPDFLRFNPEFALLTTAQAIDASGLVVEEPTSDAASALWRWVLADPEAKKWLDGTPDDWGMAVNPIYSTTAAHNSNGAPFGNPAPTSFPKADPYCYDPQTEVGSTGQNARPICLLDWSPYTLTMQAAARAAGSANSGARTTLDPTATSGETAWAANGPQRAGVRFIMTVTDSPSAARYGLQTAGLSRAGDDGADRAFITPDNPSMLTAVNAMQPTGVTHQLESDPSVSTPGAYPLTLLTYAGTTPLSLDKSARADYAAFVRYGAGSGQTPGVGAGQLPPGYVPLPKALRRQAALAAYAIQHLQLIKIPPATTTTTTQPGAQQHTSDGGGIIGGTGDDSGFTSDGGDGGISTPTDASGAVTSSPTTPLKSVHLVEASAYTKRVAGGFVRFALPILVLIGIVALGAASGRPRRRAALATAGAPLEPAPVEMPAAPAATTASAPGREPPQAAPPPPSRPSPFEPW